MYRSQSELHQKHMFHLLTAIASVLLLIFVVGTGGWTAAAATTDDPPAIVVATIFPLADVAARIGGDAVTAKSLLPPGASPHTFDPRPGDVRSVAEAQLFFTVGGGLDEWAGKVLEAAGRSVPNVSAVELVRKARLGLPPVDPRPQSGLTRSEPSETAANAMDPHVWTDPIIVRDVLAPGIAAELMGLLPAHREAIASRLAEFQKELTALDEWITDQFASVKQRGFISYHSAWPYYAARYGLEQLASVTPFPGQEPSARWLAELVRLAKRHHVRVIFAEPQLHLQAAQTISRELGGQVLILDPIGGATVPDRDSYIALMKYNTGIFAAGLKDR